MSRNLRVDAGDMQHVWSKKRDKFVRVDDELRSGSRQFASLLAFIKHKFQEEFEDFVESCDVSGVDVFSDNLLPLSSAGIREEEVDEEVDGNIFPSNEERVVSSKETTASSLDIVYGIVLREPPAYSSFHIRLPSSGVENMDIENRPSIEAVRNVDQRHSSVNLYKSGASNPVGSQTSTISQWEFEEFVDAPERFEASGRSASGDQNTWDVSTAADAGCPNSEETEETYLLQRTSSTNQLNEQCEDFVEEKFNPSGFVEPAESEYSDFCYADFANALRLSNNDAHKEVQSELEPSTSRTTQDLTESDLETTRKQVGFGSRKTKPARKEGPRGSRLIGSSTFFSHKQNDPKVRRFKCSVCSKRFLCARNLRNHELTHTDEKPYQCSFCEKSFRQMGNLRTHQLTHTDEKPHKCSSCDKSFRLTSHLRNHELTHTGEKLHECSFCERLFRYMSTLRRHQLTHQEKHKCPSCLK